MSTNTKDLDDAFLEAALEEVFQSAAPTAAQPKRASWRRSLLIAAALLLGTVGVLAVHWYSNTPPEEVPTEADPTESLRDQDPAKTGGPIIEPRDVDHARELLQQVQSISLTVTRARKAAVPVWVEPWQNGNRIALENRPAAVSSVCAHVASCLTGAEPQQVPIDNRNELSLHVPTGRIACAFDPNTKQLHVRGLGAWQTNGPLATWLLEKHEGGDELARRRAGVVTPADLANGAAWTEELTTIRPVQFGDKDIPLLRQCKNLRTLDLSQARVSPPSLSVLAAVPTLRVLVLDGWTDPKPARTHNHSVSVDPTLRPFWLQMAQSLRKLPQLEVISLRNSDAYSVLFGKVPNAEPVAAAWPNLKHLDLAGCRTLPYKKYEEVTANLPRAFVSLPKVHCEGELRLQHPPYDPTNPHAERQLRSAVEFAKERGLAIVSVDVERPPRPGFTASDGSRGTRCTVGPDSRVIRQGRADYQWEIVKGQAIALYPATDRNRVLLLHFYGGNWIATDARIESLVEHYLR